MWNRSLFICRKVLQTYPLQTFRIPAVRYLRVWAAACAGASIWRYQVPHRPWSLRCRYLTLAPASGDGVECSSDQKQPLEASDEGELESDETGPLLPKFNIDVLVSLLRQENAKDICVIKVPLELRYTDYFVIASASSTRHLQAMAQYALKVYKHLKEKKDPQVQIEGKDTDDWMCIDFGIIVVHFMLPETREIYELEKLWTLRSYDDQLAKIATETFPEDFIFGLNTEKEILQEGFQRRGERGNL
ncbi:mitochondrial assembly of ribosomal large subunit protein 1 [Pleurodeles waltl]|uniref:mitochondrial assembly of ribosomal large subunit protein 1 n=1 Tax=Pleurodeles waltl TaxID=8319 RepID=UPI00370993DA